MKRGANAPLTRENPGLTGVVAGIRADAGAETVLTDNLVVAAILCGPDRKVVSDEHFVFFNQLATPDMSVQRIEEALGADRDQIEIDLHAVPDPVASIVFVMYVNDGLSRGRSLGRLRRCEIRVLDLATGAELIRSEDLAGALTAETGLALGELYRHQRDWKFRVLGDGYAEGILGLARDYGLTL
ncbi:tellurium resistance protein TerD [Actinoplanes philippinensis]|uniref:Tellurium resistance protein TerD n=1 Tax=Actinoplanes philippinensis TaxID=35752 RepID=A0A1I2I4V2_9ACTN|nr:TerD family protein [Actinoplanes philippinensis]SFF36137.1 tellurium resistance protein TerD [Actinoplanes philippinensis]